MRARGRFRAGLVPALLLAAVAVGCAPLRPAAPVALPEFIADSVGPGDVVGVVLDQASGAPVMTAEVFMQRDTVSAGAVSGSKGSVAHALTDQEGRFALRSVPPGRYILVALKPGYRPRQTPVRVTTRVGTTIVIALSPFPCPNPSLDCP